MASVSEKSHHESRVDAVENELLTKFFATVVSAIDSAGEFVISKSEFTAMNFTVSDIEDMLQRHKLSKFIMYVSCDHKDKSECYNNKRLGCSYCASVEDFDPYEYNHKCKNRTEPLSDKCCGEKPALLFWKPRVSINKSV